MEKEHNLIWQRTDMKVKNDHRSLFSI